MAGQIKSFYSVLIANRGEIAVRIIKAARKLGLRTISIYSQEDRKSPHVKLADKAVEIGNGPSVNSYLSMSKLIDVAKQEKVEAIHPGYGFLSESAEFAKLCSEQSIVFIGPSSETISKMGDKAEAKSIALDLEVPCLAGALLTNESPDEISKIAKKIGYPIMIKAVAGGGGKGMRSVEKEAELLSAISLAKTESFNAFNSEELILEHKLITPRHVEIQVFGDSHGTLVHMGERDCSIQRRHQKIIEEAPCPTIPKRLRNEMGEVAKKIGAKLNYIGAGTIEFLLDKNEKFYFLEMNTRLQVEHPVTELVTGLDLIQLQFLVADGQKLPFTQENILFDGHAIEVRLYAEDPSREFLPSSGEVKLLKLDETEGVRIDSGIAEGTLVTPYYDPMLAKIIGYGQNREIALANLVKCLEATALVGVVSNREFLLDLLRQKSFSKGDISNAFIEKNYPHGFLKSPASVNDFGVVAVLIHAGLMLERVNQADFIPDELIGWSNMAHLNSTITLQSGERTEKILVHQRNITSYSVKIGEIQKRISIDGFNVIIDEERKKIVSFYNDDLKYHLITQSSHHIFQEVTTHESNSSNEQTGIIMAPMHGIITDILVKEGTSIGVGEQLIILEAMKMQHEIIATINGEIVDVYCAVGDQVSPDDALARIKAKE